MINEDNIDIGILITVISILSGVVFNSNIISDIINPSNPTPVIAVELSLVMLFSSIGYYVASIKLPDMKSEYREISIMQSVISLGILAGITVFWASTKIVTIKEMSNSSSLLFYVTIFVVLLLLIYSEFKLRKLIRNIQKLFGIISDSQSILGISLISVSIILLVAFVYSGLSHVFMLIMLISLPAFGIKIKKEAQKMDESNRIILYRVSSFVLIMSIGAILNIAYLFYMHKLHKIGGFNQDILSLRFILDILIVLYLVYVYLYIMYTHYNAKHFQKLHINIAEVLGISFIAFMLYYVSYKKNNQLPGPNYIPFIELSLVIYTFVVIPTYADFIEETIKKIIKMVQNIYPKP
ncbi:hypothetical protein [Thermococcus chitonophagus]|uniref:Uncharacterized protein n=2 Tax=Thermococcus chitonophagus TaxID=54262 RepID=A0A160VS79_9EURY|nr:hypothetical protein [Thermococcus chitonophagus]CUX77266.1 hypothetical protein CHITON_0487 [Thermococcus chitonophagus]